MAEFIKLFLCSLSKIFIVGMLINYIVQLIKLIAAMIRNKKSEYMPSVCFLFAIVSLILNKGEVPYANVLFNCILMNFFMYIVLLIWDNRLSLMLKLRRRKRKRAMRERSRYENKA